MKSGHWIFAASLLAFLAVALGAFGAHALSARFGDYEKGVWQTAVFYHLTHSIALLALAFAFTAIPGLRAVSGASAVPWLFAFGILIFSGSLYALALSGIKVLGAVTPLGGVSLLIGWVMLARVGLLYSPGVE
jgi:uncharacterized membrane protein YgdD (TMEM256/DUF423 family)